MFHGQPTYYIQGQTYPVDTSHPGHYMIHHMEGMNSDLELTPYRQGQADIFRINFTHLNEPPVPLYRYISTLKGGYDGETFIYESVPLNNTRVVFKQFFTTTRSQPVPRDARSKMLSEARALNRIITGESDWTSGMSELVEEHNLWGWPSSGTDGKVPKHDKPWRHYRMDWPVEVAASMRRWAPFREVIERLGEEMNCTEIGRPKKIERWSIEEEQEEGELIRVLDVFYLPDFEIMEVDVGDKPKKERLAENQKQKRPQPKQQTAEDFAKETSMESVALKEAGLIKEMSEDLAERREMNGNRDTIPTRQKKILRNLSTDIESWGMVLPLLEGGDVRLAPKFCRIITNSSRRTILSESCPCLGSHRRTWIGSTAHYSHMVSLKPSPECTTPEKTSTTATNSDGDSPAASGIANWEPPSLLTMTTASALARTESPELGVPNELPTTRKGTATETSNSTTFLSAAPPPKRGPPSKPPFPTATPRPTSSENQKTTSQS